MCAAVKYDDVSYAQDVILGMWGRIERDILKQWAAMTQADCDNVAGDVSSLSEMLQSKYSLSRGEAQDLVVELAERYDQLLPDYQPETVRMRAMGAWSQIPHERLRAIADRRSTLVGLVALHYGLKREVAWRQVNKFLTSLRR